MVSVLTMGVRTISMRIVSVLMIDFNSLLTLRTLPGLPGLRRLRRLLSLHALRTLRGIGFTTLHTLRSLRTECASTKSTSAKSMRLRAKVENQVQILVVCAFKWKVKCIFEHEIIYI